MPRMNGIELVRHSRKNDPQFKKFHVDDLYLTKKGMVTALSRIEAGASYYLLKVPLVMKLF